MQNQEQEGISQPAESPPSAVVRLWKDKWVLRIFFIALAIRMAYLVLFLYSPLSTDLRGDHLYYFAWAQRIASGGWVGSDVFEQGPLYAYALGILFQVIGARMPTVLLVQLALGSLSCAVLYACARRLFDSASALAVGILACAYGPLVFYECMIMKSFLSPFLTVIVLYGGLRYQRLGARGALILAGIAVGLGCLVRENHILLAIPLAAAVWMAERGGRDLTRRFTDSLILASGIILCLIPSTVHNWRAGGELVFVTSGGGEVFYMSYGPWARGYYSPPDFVVAAPGREHEDFRGEASLRTGQPLTRQQASRYWRRQAFDYVLRHPWQTVRLTAHKAIILLNDYEVPDTEDFYVARRFIPSLLVLPSFGWISGLGFVGIVLAARQGRRYLLPLGLLAAHVASVLLTYNFARFRLGMAPLWILFAGYGLVWTCRSLYVRPASSRKRGWIAAGAAAILTAGAFYPIHPAGYEVGESLLAGKLAENSGNLAVAEAEFRQAISIIDRTAQNSRAEQPPWDAVVTAHMELAGLLAETGRNAEAVQHCGVACRLPNRPENQASTLVTAFSILYSIARNDPSSDLRRQAEAELRFVLTQMQALEPASIQYLALAAMFAENREAAEELATRIRSAWNEKKGDAPPDETMWYYFGLSCVSRRQEDPKSQLDYARKAIESCPDHSFRPEIERFLGGLQSEPERSEERTPPLQKD